MWQETTGQVEQEGVSADHHFKERRQGLQVSLTGCRASLSLQNLQGVHILSEAAAKGGRWCLTSVRNALKDDDSSHGEPRDQAWDGGRDVDVLSIEGKADYMSQLLHGSRAVLDSSAAIIGPAKGRHRKPARKL